MHRLALLKDQTNQILITFLKLYRMTKRFLSLFEKIFPNKRERNNKKEIMEGKVAEEIAKKISEDARMHRKIRES